MPRRKKRKIAPPWSEDDDKRLAELYAAGWSRPEIASEIGRTTAAVSQRIVNLKIARRPKPKNWLQRDDDAIIRMRAVERLTVQQIADRLERSKSTVSQRIVKLGLTRQVRGRGELERQVVYWHGKGLDDSAIAKKLRLRSSTAVRNVRVRLALGPNITPQERSQRALAARWQLHREREQFEEIGREREEAEARRLAIEPEVLARGEIIRDEERPNETRRIYRVPKTRASASIIRRRNRL